MSVWKEKTRAIKSCCWAEKVAETQKDMMSVAYPDFLRFSDICHYDSRIIRSPKRNCCAILPDLLLIRIPQKLCVDFLLLQSPSSLCLTVSAKIHPTSPHTPISTTACIPISLQSHPPVVWPVTSRTHTSRPKFSSPIPPINE